MGSPNADEARETAITVTELPLALIRPGNNDRHVFSESELDELAASITEVGLVQPVTVRRVLRSLDGTEYELVAGVRRFRAHQRLGKPTIRALVEDLPDEKAAVVMLVENLQRTDLNPIEEALAYRERIDRFGQTVEDVAATAGVKPSRVRDRLALLRLHPDIEAMVRNKQLGPWFGSQLARLDHNRQMIGIQVYRRTPNMAWEDFAAMVERLLLEQNQESMFDSSVLQIETYLMAQPREPRRFARRQLIRTIAALVDVLDADVTSSDREVVEALAEGRAALAGEEGATRIA